MLTVLVMFFSAEEWQFGKLNAWSGSEIEDSVSDLLLHCVHLVMGLLEVAAARGSLLRDAQSNNN